MTVVLVTGGTGKIGSELVALLAADERISEVRPAARNPQEHQAELLRLMAPLKVRPVRLDIDDRNAVLAAFEGVTRLCLIAPIAEDMAGWQRKIVDAASDVPLDYVVKSSVIGARAPGGDPEPGPLPLAHWEGEEAVRSLGIPHTIVRPNIFMQHFVSVPQVYEPGAERFYLPTGDGRMSFLDCRDIALALATLLAEPPKEGSEFRDAAFTLTGPEALSASEVGKRLTHARGSEVAWESAESAYDQHAATTGSEGPKGIYLEAKEGSFANIETAPFERLVGRPPRPFARFAHDYSANFRSRPSQEAR